MKRRSTPEASETTTLVPVQLDGPPPSGFDVTTDAKVGEFLSRLLPAAAKAKTNPAAALLPWVCDRLVSKHSREAYARDLSSFVRHMRQQGIDPLAVTADHIKVYKAALIQAGRSPTSIARAMSVIRGTYQQFGRHGLVEWERVRDIQGVASPRVEKNLTPALSEAEAKKLLHAPDQSTIAGLRDHAMLFAFFKTACRCSAIANAKVGYLERTDTDWHLVVFEKGNKRQRKALLEAAAPLLVYVAAAEIGDDRDGPLFRPVAKDRQTLLRKPLDRRTIWKTVKKYARQVGIDVDRLGGRGIGVHSLRKTAITNALEHGARMEQVQQLAGHAQITTTQMYFAPKDRDSEDAARHIQIR